MRDFTKSKFEHPESQRSAGRTSIELDVPETAAERVALADARRVESIATQIGRAIKFQQEIILSAEKEIERLRGLYAHAGTE